MCVFGGGGEGELGREKNSETLRYINVIWMKLGIL